MQNHPFNRMMKHRTPTPAHDTHCKRDGLCLEDGLERGEVDDGELAEDGASHCIEEGLVAQQPQMKHTLVHRPAAT